MIFQIAYLCAVIFSIYGAHAASIAPDSKMRTLAGGVQISKMGIGTWAWGSKVYWNYNTEQDDALQATFNHCILKGGVNLFDTAELYGRGKSELLLGRFKRKVADQNIVFASKFAPLPWRFGPDAVLSACRDSLDRMGVESIGLYQLHFPAIPSQNEAYWDGVAKCYQKGLIKAVGVSNYGPRTLRNVHRYLADRNVPLSTNQIQYSMISRSAERNGLLDTCAELGVTVLAYSPLAQGVLTGKYGLRKLPRSPRAAVMTAVMPRISPLLDSMQAVAAAKTASLGFNVSMSQVAINWCISKGTVPIPGARTRAQAVDNCNALKWKLSSEEIIMLDTISRNTRINIPSPLQSL